jgi:anti-anti-sigma factor
VTAVWWPSRKDNPTMRPLSAMYMPTLSVSPGKVPRSVALPKRSHDTAWVRPDVANEDEPITTPCWLTLVQEPTPLSSVSGRTPRLETVPSRFHCTARRQSSTPTTAEGPIVMVQNLHIAQVVFSDAVVVTVAGDVDLCTGGLLTKGLIAAGLVSLPPRAMVVDLSAVTFFGAAGLTSLVMADHRCRVQGITLQIVANRRVVLRPLEITGLSKTLPVVPALRPEWARRRRTIRASRAMVDAARRILLADCRTNAKKASALVD